MAAITREEVEHLARLARLELSEGETDHYAEQLSAIVDAVARVSEVTAEEIPPTSHPIPVTNVFREDVARPGLDRNEIAAAAPAWEDERFRVPRILGEE
ncbi:MAG TPA: Asp-tRNA(Asn)/Glu-tRNA(Gln) amidotransferase subunit GatC [Candidatus Nanopelagicales bacterium]|nr:Asp-tRNA(Asn)/Glu-tRNA(Gln) amidotransferase subunit GatC [Candidatus Nanopelagicales bacterium]